MTARTLGAFICALLLSLASFQMIAKAEDAHSPERLAEARQLYEKGNTRYALGDYDAAVALFRRAYELSPAPALLFDIAQAYRLSGNCGRALDAYRHFVRLDPSSEHRAEAEAQLTSLGERCGGAPSPGTSSRLERAPSERPSHDGRQAPPTAPTARSTRDRVVLGLLGAGVILGVSSGALYLWNDHRFSGWSEEDRVLLGTPPANVTTQEWTTRQNANDARLHSIQRADLVTAVLVGVSATCLLGSAAAAYVPLRGSPTLAVSGSDLVIAWNGRWP